MVKHNNVIPNGHFHKDWQRFVKTWFNQPAQKKARREARVAKAKKVAPRPLNLLRSAVRCPTIKYNRKVRAGRGFTLAELKAAGFHPQQARGLGVCVDHRRHNRSQEGFNLNVQRLKEYKAKLVVFPRKSNGSIKKGDSSVDEQKQTKQVTSKQTLAIVAPDTSVEARKITKEERLVKAAAALRKATTDAKLWGKRAKRAVEKADAAKAGATKEAKGKKGGDDDD